MKKRINIIIALILMQLLPFSLTMAQNQYKQTIRGNVVDNESQTSLPGATVVILNTTPIIGTSTDAYGDFKIENVPIGRYDLQVSFLGYEPYVIPEILVGTGKEIVLNVGLKESFTTMKEVVIKGDIKKDQPLNSMASISARTFSVEETQRYAGSIDDPARMASAFAGVTVGNLQDNAIVIRGNSPKGVAWHLENVEIPNPNHFAGGNVAGGGFVTIFSSHLLANSDFYTGAFPAEYSNALAGIFDMKLRNGNNEKREYTFQAGVLGIDFASEGPFLKGKKSSYIFNYRYSTFSLLTSLHIIPGQQVPRYQDLSFKINLPSKNAGTFSLWGIGGIDYMDQPYIIDSSKWESDWDRLQMKWNLYTGAFGVSNKLPLGANTYVNTTLAATGVFNQLDQKRVEDDLNIKPYSLLTDQSKKIQINSYLKHKFNARHTVKTGINFNELFFNFDLNGIIDEQTGLFQNYIYQKGNSYYAEAYLESKYDITDKLLVNSGININYFALNSEFITEPRIAFKWNFMQHQALSIGYGKHSQMEELRMYFIDYYINGEKQYPNKNLSLAKAHHLILGYDWNISNYLRLKIEPYYQYLYDVPGIKDSSWSMINFEQDWSFRNTLVNNSVGKNFGIDITLERFLNKNYYYLITASIFKSVYRGGDGIWRDTRFDKNFVINLLAGKEFKLKSNKVFGINGRFNFMGGQRLSPVLVEQSMEMKEVVYDYSKAFSKKSPFTYYLDLSTSYRVNKMNYSYIWTLQVKNILGCPLYEGEFYNYRTNNIETSKTVVIVPVISYKIEF
jgi:hypothetical protein